MKMFRFKGHEKSTEIRRFLKILHLKEMASDVRKRFSPSFERPISAGAITQ